MMGRLEVEEEPVNAEEQTTEAVTVEDQLTQAVSANEVSEAEIDLTAFEVRIGKEKAENFIMPDR